MKAYNSRKTPREIYLFRKRGQKIVLTKIHDFIGEEIHSTFKVITKDKVAFLKCNYAQKFAFEKQLMKILFSKPKLITISSMIAFFKGFYDNGAYSIDFSKVQRKDFVSRDIAKIKKILKEKGILKEKNRKLSEEEK